MVVQRAGHWAVHLAGQTVVQRADSTAEWTVDHWAD